MSQFRCKDSINRTQNQIKKHFFYLFVEMPPILSKNSVNYAEYQIKSQKFYFIPIIPPILSSITHPHGRPRRINNRTMCVKQSQLCCVDNHEQPFRARACLRVQNSRFTGWSPLLRRGGWGRGGASPIRRGRVR